MWVGYGIEYTSFPWNESDSNVDVCYEIIRNGDPGQIAQIVAIVTDVINEGNSILVHSMYGRNRSVFAVSCFLMHR
jgi:protein-tyrosine phosphatase